jgi:hypothetical protein
MQGSRQSMVRFCSRTMGGKCQYKDESEAAKCRMCGESRGDKQRAIREADGEASASASASASAGAGARPASGAQQRVSQVILRGALLQGLPGG